VVGVGSESSAPRDPDVHPRGVETRNRSIYHNIPRPCRSRTGNVGVPVEVSYSHLLTTVLTNPRRDFTELGTPLVRLPNPPAPAKKPEPRTRPESRPDRCQGDTALFHPVLTEAESAHPELLRQQRR
jgi:hypothetical protein